MNINFTPLERSSLSAFAERYGFTMRIRERAPHHLGPRWHEGLRYYASFECVEVKDGSVLIGEYGNGSTPHEAMENYAKEISGKTLVFNAGRPNRQEIRAPLVSFP